MRIKSVNILNGGEILAEPIFTEKNEILIPKGTELKKDYIPLIESLGIDSLMIEDPYENYEKPHPIISATLFDKYVERVQGLMENHIYHSNKSLREFEIIANDILKEVDKISNDVIIDMKERSSNLYEHTVMVTLLSLVVAKKLKIDRKKRFNIAVGCLLHDIGIRYITVPYQNKDLSELDAAEIFEFKKHTILGFSALDKEQWIPDIAKKMILSHHENLEGTGFPMRQKNKEIECKIIQACDSFDCYISGMECKRTSVQEAFKKLFEEESKYDTKVLKNLSSLIAKYPVGTTVKTNEEESGVVISQTIDPENPIIMILSGDMDENNCSKLNLMLEEHISILRVV